MTAADPGTAALPAPRYAAGAARSALFVAAALLLTVPGLEQLTTHTVGDSGDAFFILHLLEWGAHQLPQGFRDYWAGTFFLGAHLPLAYSDTHLGIVPVYWALRELGAPAPLAFNLLYLASWVISCEATFRLARRITGSDAASIVAAFGFTFSVIRLGQYGHFQLCFGALLPLVFLLLLGILDRPRWWLGPALGLTWAIMTLSASYYGVASAIAMAVVTAMALVRRRGRLDRATVLALTGAALTALVIVGPVALRHLELQRDPHFRRTYDPQFAARWEDFRVVPASFTELSGIGFLRSTDPTRTSENYAFPGLVVSGFAVVGAVTLASRRRWEAAGLPAAGRWELGQLATVGAVALLLALGRNTTVFGLAVLPPLSDLAAAVVPGFEGMRALVRLAVLTQLALAVVAAAGLARVLARLRHRPATTLLAPALAGALVVTIAWEATVAIGLARPPDATRGGAVNVLLAGKPPGGVVEYPIVSHLEGMLWPLVEAPRMVLTTLDWKPRVGGYSGFWPPGYLEQVGTLRGFPSPRALDQLDRLGVRYVVLRTGPVDVDLPWADDKVAASGFGWMDPATAAAVVATIPPHRIDTVERVDGAVLVTLRSG